MNPDTYLADLGSLMGFFPVYCLCAFLRCLYHVLFASQLFHRPVYDFQSCSDFFFSDDEWGCKSNDVLMCRFGLGMKCQHRRHLSMGKIALGGTY